MAMKTISLKLPDSLLARLNSAAKCGKRSKSEYVRHCLENAMENQETDLKGSCFDLAADLCGIIEGPDDLSYNKKHMARFGR
jgi:metal-responsive CopG/Arc/MetJ family transcriptional regulator